MNLGRIVVYSHLHLTNRVDFVEESQPRRSNNQTPVFVQLRIVKPDRIPSASQVLAKLYDFAEFRVDRVPSFVIST